MIPNRTVLDKAYKEILSLVWADKYVKYTDHIVVQRQLRVSRLEALWWKEVGEPEVVIAAASGKKHCSSTVPFHELRWPCLPLLTDS